MFSKKEKTSAAGASSSSPGKKPGLDTVLGPGAELVGDIKVNAGARIDGKIKGNVVCQGDLTVGEKGLVEGEIKAVNLLLAGKVKGKINADNTAEITSTGSLEGDIVCSKLIIAEGAFFQGNCQMNTPKAQVPESGPMATTS